MQHKLYRCPVTIYYEKKIADPFLLLLFNVAGLAEKQQIPILKSVVRPYRGSNP
jgi:hypothetical protein